MLSQTIPSNQAIQVEELTVSNNLGESLSKGTKQSVLERIKWFRKKAMGDVEASSPRNKKKLKNDKAWTMKDSSQSKNVYVVSEMAFSENNPIMFTGMSHDY